MSQLWRLIQAIFEICEVFFQDTTRLLTRCQVSCPSLLKAQCHNKLLRSTSMLPEKFTKRMTSRIVGLRRRRPSRLRHPTHTIETRCPTAIGRFRRLAMPRRRPRCTRELRALCGSGRFQILNEQLHWQSQPCANPRTTGLSQSTMLGGSTMGFRHPREHASHHSWNMRRTPK